MTLNQLETSLTTNLKNYLKQTGHIDSGKLLNSFSISVSNDLTISTTGLEYMQYLDDGKFLNDFFELQSSLDLIEEYIVSSYEF